MSEHLIEYMVTHPFFNTSVLLVGVIQPLSQAQRSIVYFTVTGGNEAGVDLVLIQPFLLCYVNNVVFMLTSIFKHNFHKKRKEVCIKTRSTSASHLHSKARITVKWSILDLFGCLPASPSLGIIPFMCLIATSHD